MRREVDPDPYCPQAALVDEETNRRTERRLARYRARFEAEKLHREKMAALEQRRRQGMWMAGGALFAVAVGWIWYRKYVQRGKRRRSGRGTGGDDGLPRDLFFEEDDGVSEEELEQVFDEAAKAARKFPDGMLVQRDQLMLYGLYKQAKEGDRNVDAPSKLSVVAYAKYDSWGKFKGLPKQFAMKKYCEVVYHFSTGGKSAFCDGKGDENADVTYDDDDDQRDLDEDGCPVNEDGGDLGDTVTGMGLRPSTLSGSLDTGPQNKICSTPEQRLRDAAMSNDVASLQEIMGGECDKNGGDEAGQTALHFAADRGSIECLKLLVEAEANVNAADCDGIGVLQTALSSGLNAESVKILLEAGADPDACDVDGDSPRTWVENEGDADMVDLFASFPAR
mmetsp:Transcript_52168/g.110878  ORF Transcript_52168/g.110878 Transcript_52168/m.110878 type:complete len:393 (+) Transcript_52168:98-1276(+)